jgi:hypothetical protein
VDLLPSSFVHLFALAALGSISDLRCQAHRTDRGKGLNLRPKADPMNMFFANKSTYYMA